MNTYKPLYATKIGKWVVYDTEQKRAHCRCDSGEEAISIAKQLNRAVKSIDLSTQNTFHNNAKIVDKRSDR